MWAHSHGPPLCPPGQHRWKASQAGILGMGKPRPRDVEALAQSHTVLMGGAKCPQASLT